MRQAALQTAQLHMHQSHSLGDGGDPISSHCMGTLLPAFEGACCGWALQLMARLLLAVLPAVC